MCMKTTLHWYLRVPSIFSSTRFPSQKSDGVSDTRSVAIRTLFLHLSPEAAGPGAPHCLRPTALLLQLQMSGSNITPKASTHRELPGMLLPLSLLHFLIQQRHNFGEPVRFISCGFQSISVPSKVLYPQHICYYLNQIAGIILERHCLKHWFCKCSHTWYNLIMVAPPMEISDTMWVFALYLAHNGAV